jgi:8-amino-7-oxononanoate synthase
MLDFTSALYLGLHHSSEALRPWTQLTAGKPAALTTPRIQCRVAQALAELQGCERATLGSSTLHLFWDLFGRLAKQNIAIYLDAGAYPIVRWGAERATARGVPLRCFPHHQPEGLRRQLAHDARRGLRPLIVCNGFCPGCGQPAPLAAYLAQARAWGGYLLLDDTQALGIFGRSPDRGTPYGRGGGGMLPWSGVNGPEVLVVSSLAKGFGVPVAVLAGSEALVAWFERHSETRVHCSPPSAAVLHAAARALAVNRDRGESLRWRLAQRVRHFCRRLKHAGLASTGGLFPVQTLKHVTGTQASVLHRQLCHKGVQAVLQRGRRVCLSFLLTAQHRREEIDRAVDLLAQALAPRAYIPILAIPPASHN